MYQIKNQIYLDMTKNQKSALCNFLRALVKKSPELSVEDIFDKFLDDERYYFEINNPHFEFLENYLDDEKLFFKIIRSAFAQHRKTLVNGLSNGLSIDKNIISEIISGCSLPLDIRGEKLSLEEFSQIANKLHKGGH